MTNADCRLQTGDLVYNSLNNGLVRVKSAPILLVMALETLLVCTLHLS